MKGREKKVIQVSEDEVLGRNVDHGTVWYEAKSWQGLQEILFRVVMIET